VDSSFLNFNAAQVNYYFQERGLHELKKACKGMKVTSVLSELPNLQEKFQDEMERWASSSLATLSGSSKENLLNLRGYPPTLGILLRKPRAELPACC